MSVVPNLAVKGLTLNLFDLPNVDLDKKWWSEDYVEGAMVNGKIFMGVGDIAHSIYEGMEVIFINETMAYSYLDGIDIYQIVEDGDWTFEKLEEYTNTVQYNENEGNYGLLLNAHAVRNFNASFEVEMAVQDAVTKKYSFPLTPTERTGNIFEALRDFCNSNTSVYYKEKTQDDIKASNVLFGGSKALFYAQYLKAAESLISSEVDYGILPFPKWDDNQLEYHTSLKDDVTAFCVPYNIKNREMVGTILEALCMYGYQKVRPAYYEQVLSYRLLGRPELADMLNSIRDSVTIRFEMAYNWTLGYPYSFGSGLLSDTPITSGWESQSNTWSEGIAKLYEGIR